MKKKGNMMHLTYEHKPVMTLIGFSTLIRMEEGKRHPIRRRLPIPMTIRTREPQ